MQLICTNLLSVQLARLLPGTKHDLPTQFGVKFCPSMDLVAVFPRILPSEKAIDAANSQQATAEDYYAEEDDEEVHVDIYRLNGQKVFTTSIESKSGSVGIADVAWRDDGIILAITASDNSIRLVNSFSGKVVHIFSLRPENRAIHSEPTHNDPTSPNGKRKSQVHSTAPRKRRCMPTSLHYSTHFSDPQQSRRQLSTANEERGIVIDDLLGLNVDIDSLLKVDTNLPKELASLDVEQYLPKLATLPPNGMGEDDVFSSRASIDAIFHPMKQNVRSKSIDVMTIAQSNGYIHLRIFDAFEVGDIDLSQSLHLPAGAKLGHVKGVAAHPFIEEIYVIAEEVEEEQPRRQTRSHDATQTEKKLLHLLSLDLKFLRQTSHMLPVLATKAAQLYNLTRYLVQIESQLAREVKAAFDLPVRFIRTLEEELKEQDGKGSTFETSVYHVMLTGEVHGKFKEWLVDILGDRGVERWEKAVAECLDLVRRLVGECWNSAVERAGIAASRLAGLSAANSTFGVDKRIIDGIKDTISVMSILGEELLKDVNSEISGFSAFIRWLKREVEMAALEDTSEKLDEMRESSDHSEVRKVLKYISERLHNTSVKQYIHQDHSIDHTSFSGADDVGYYAQYKQARTNGKEGIHATNMKYLTSRLVAQCGRMFNQVAKQLQENVMTQHLTPLPAELDAEFLDSRITYEPEYATLHMFGKLAGHNSRLCWVRRALGIQAASTIETTEAISLDDSEHILDIKFVDDKEVLVLVETKTQAKVFGIDLLNSSNITVRHVFGSSNDKFIREGLRPWKLDVNGRRGRRVMTVLDKDGRGYGVFDLDSSGGIIDGDDTVMREQLY